MAKIIFTHCDEEKTKREALRAEMKADYDAFIASGRKVSTPDFGATNDPEGRIVTGIKQSDVSRQRAAQVNRKHGGPITAKQKIVLDAIVSLAEMPGVMPTRQGIRNKLKTIAGNTLTERLKSLEAKGVIKVKPDRIELIGGGA